MSAIDNLIASAGVFTELALFGSAATYTPAGTTAASTINVNFTEPGSIEDPQGVEGQTSQPMALIASAAAPAIKRGDKLVIDGVTYRVQSAVPDGLGSTVLGLTRESAAQTPAALTGLACTTTPLPGAASLNLIWTNPGGGTAVEVWGYRPGDAEFKQGTFAAAATGGTITGTGDDIWTYRARLLGATGPGPWSNVIIVNTTV